MAHAVASHQGLHCFSIYPFIGFLAKECIYFSLFTEEKDKDDMLEDEIDGDLHHFDDDEDISNSSEDIKSRIPEIFKQCMP